MDADPRAMSSNRASTPDELVGLLLNEGVIDSTTAEATLERLRDSWIPLGRILRQHNKLSMSHLMQLLQLQSGEPHLRLGELAVREGFCSDADVRDALRMQREVSPHLLDMLAGDPKVELGKLMQVATRYVRLLEARLGRSHIDV
jgi:hypothetical protein